MGKGDGRGQNLTRNDSAKISFENLWVGIGGDGNGNGNGIGEGKELGWREMLSQAFDAFPVVFDIVILIVLKTCFIPTWFLFT